MISLLFALAATPIALDPRTEACIVAVHAADGSARQACAKLPAQEVQLWGSKAPPPPETCPAARSLGEIIGGLGPSSGATWNSNMRRQFDERIAECRAPAASRDTPTLKIPQLWD